MKLKAFVLCSMLAVNAMAADGNITVSEGQAPQEKIDFAKVTENLNRIAQKVREQNPQLLESISLDMHEADGWVSKSLMFALIAKSQIFNQFKIDAEINTMDLKLSTIDSGSIEASAAVNGYELVKRFYSISRGSSSMTSEEWLQYNIKKGAEACEKVSTVDKKNFEDRAVVFMDCAAQYHLLKSKSFSEFLISVQPLSKQFRALANKAYYEHLKTSIGEMPVVGAPAAWFTYYVLSGNDLSVCTKKDWTCRGEYIYAKLTGTIGAGRLAGAVTLSEKEIKVKLTAYSIRALTDLATGTASGSAFEKAKYEILHDMQTMDDARIESLAKDMSEFLQHLAQELERLKMVK